MREMSESLVWVYFVQNLLVSGIESVFRTLPCSIAFLSVLLVLGACGYKESDESAEIEKYKKPNVLLIVADDLGFTDISSFGSEIQTPNIDAIARFGMRFSRFYTGSMCAPTRAMLMTGADHHLTGMGNMAEFLTESQRGNPGYEGYLNKRTVILPELLVKQGYHAYMTGKWHLGYEHDQSPRARGFERSFALLNGAGSHYQDMRGTDIDRPKASYREDGELIDALPKGFYSSRSYTDKLIDYIESNRTDGRPFFAYAAYTSPHWPLQAPDDIRDKYVGIYDEGYDDIRAERYRAVKRLGLIPEQASIPVRPSFVPPWDSLTETEKRIAAREMEVYAAMVSDLDRNIGRLINYLKKNDLFENTLVVFMSDNGSDALSLTSAPPAIAQQAAKHNNSLANMGKPNSFNFIGPKWAHVGEAPFRLYKKMSTEGGIRVPAIISFPGKKAVKKQGMQINRSVVSVMDLLPTILELADIEFAENVKDSRIIKPMGRSLIPILSGKQATIRSEKDVLGFELLGRRAIVKGRWKILLLPEPTGSGKWQLFDLETDPGEQVDLAEAKPYKLSELIKDWDNYVATNNVILPLPSEALRGNRLKSPTR